MTLANQMTQKEAQDVTERIRGSAEELWALLVDAYEGAAHKVLGYDTWKSYVKAEFHMTPRNSYYLLDQAQVIKALSAGGSETRFTAREVQKIKPHLDEIVEDIEQGTEPDEAISRALAQEEPMATMPARTRAAMSRQRRAILDLKPGKVLVLPHDGYSCERRRHCGLSKVVHTLREQQPDYGYVIGHTSAEDFVVGCFDPTNIENLNY